MRLLRNLSQALGCPQVSGAGKGMAVRQKWPAELSHCLEQPRGRGQQEYRRPEDAALVAGLPEDLSVTSVLTTYGWWVAWRCS